MSEKEAPEGKERSLKYMQGTQRKGIENKAPEGKERYATHARDSKRRD